jgi:hypothetical protein
MSVSPRIGQLLDHFPDSDIHSGRLRRRAGDSPVDFGDPPGRERPQSLSDGTCHGNEGAKKPFFDQDSQATGE